MKRSTTTKRKRKLPPRQMQIRVGEIVDVINDVLAVSIDFSRRLDKLEGRNKRTIGFSTDCYGNHDVGDGESADDYETGDN